MVPLDNLEIYNDYYIKITIMTTISTEGVANAYGFSGTFSLDIGTLEGQHPIYSANKTMWREITELYTGGSLLENNKQHYLTQRPGESDDLYKLRIAKFSYNNLLAKGLNTLSNQLSTGQLSVGNATSEFWTKFRENIDIAGTSEKEFTNNIFREILLYGRVFVHVDKTVSDIIPRTKQEEKELGLRPYLTTYSAPQVYDWDEDKGKLTFLKVRQEVRHRETPFSSPVTKIIWSYITEDMVAKYQTYVDRDEFGAYKSFVDPYGNPIRDFNDEATLEPEIIEHGYGECPVKMLALSSEMWLSSLVIHKLKEALQLENFIFDAISIGCHLQRTYKPYVNPDANKGAFIEVCDDDALMLGNATVIRVDDYRIVEMEGSAVRVAMERLKTIQQEILVVITSKTINYDQTNYIASGNSKRIDFVEQAASLVNFGTLLREFYQDLINLIVRSNSNIVDTKPYVHGYTSFELDNVADLLLLGQSLITVAQFMPPIALKAFSDRLSQLILDTDDPKILIELEEQLNQMDFTIPEIKELEPNKSLDPNLASTPKRTSSILTPDKEDSIKVKFPHDPV